MIVNNKGEINAVTRYDVFRNGAKYAELQADGIPSITAQANSELKLSFKGTFIKNDAVDFLTDRIKPYITINGTEYPCGLFIVTTQTEHKSKDLDTVDIEAYSLLYLLQRAKTETLRYFAKGTPYMSVIQGLCTEIGITEIVADSSDLTLTTDREDWEIGTSYITIINQLLSEINFNSAWVDLNGFIHFSKYSAPNADDIQHIYRADEASIIGDDLTITNDIHDKSNVFIVQCSNPDLSTVMSATSVNDSISSPFSTVNLGMRIVEVTKVDNIASQTELQAYADNLKFKSMLSTETIDFTTAINPTHVFNDSIILDIHNVQDIFTETEWNMSLSANAEMTHKAKRVLYL